MLKHIFQRMTGANAKLHFNVIYILDRVPPPEPPVIFPPLDCIAEGKTSRCFHNAITVISLSRIHTLYVQSTHFHMFWSPCILHVYILYATSMY